MLEKAEELQTCMHRRQAGKQATSGREPWKKQWMHMRPWVGKCEVCAEDIAGEKGVVLPL